MNSCCLFADSPIERVGEVAAYVIDNFLTMLTTLLCYSRDFNSCRSLWLDAVLRYKKAGFGLKPIAMLEQPAHLEKCSELSNILLPGDRQAFVVRESTAAAEALRLPPSCCAVLGGTIIEFFLGIDLLKRSLKFVSLLSCVKRPTKLKLRLV